jgi:hypothetical protein
MELNKKKTVDLDSLPKQITHPSEISPAIIALSNANLGNLEFAARVNGLISPALALRSSELKGANHTALAPSLSLSAPASLKKSRSLE